MASEWRPGSPYPAGGAHHARFEHPRVPARTAARRTVLGWLQNRSPMAMRVLADPPWAAGGKKTRNRQRRPGAAVRHTPGKDSQIPPRGCPSPGCPDLNAIEEVWRQMKHAVLDVPYIRLSSMCGDIDKWLRSSLPKLDIERCLYRKA